MQVDAFLDNHAASDMDTSTVSNDSAQLTNAQTNAHTSTFLSAEKRRINAILQEVIRSAVSSTSTNKHALHSDTHVISNHDDDDDEDEEEDAMFEQQLNAIIPTSNNNNNNNNNKKVQNSIDNDDDFDVEDDEELSLHSDKDDDDEDNDNVLTHSVDNMNSSIDRSTASDHNNNNDASFGFDASDVDRSYEDLLLARISKHTSNPATTYAMNTSTGADPYPASSLLSRQPSNRDLLKQVVMRAHSSNQLVNGNNADDDFDFDEDSDNNM
jgi:hypothetical protein